MEADPSAREWVYSRALQLSPNGKRNGLLSSSGGRMKKYFCLI